MAMVLRIRHSGLWFLFIAIDFKTGSYEEEKAPLSVVVSVTLAGVLAKL